MRSIDTDSRSLHSSTSRSTIAEPAARKKNKGSIIPRLWPLRSKNRKNSGDFADSLSVGGLRSSWRVSSYRRSNASRSSSHLSSSKKTTGYMECPLCLMERPKEHFPEIVTCDHRSCRECLRQYLKIEITESRVNIACPECAEPLHPNDIKIVLQDDILMSKYEEFTLRRLLMMDPDCRWCPAPDCGYAVIATGCANCPQLMCIRPGCCTSFCYHCKQTWHPNQTCDAARQQRSGYIRKRSVSYSTGSASSDQIKPCPRCTALIIKMDDGSCNHMTCAVCGAEFCWLCMKEISDLHYLSPSGCTFWGKKPWSRKKKILWQLGTLVGAPVGIALVAGIAIPAIIIGIPVYVGRKVHAKYAQRSRSKRNLAITGSVVLSIIVSPLIAALTVGIGVPIMLAYVYGVVPISLCRSGGCGVRTSNSGGVRIDFDDENDVTIGTSGIATENNHDVSSVIANASIGEASVMNRESTSHLEVAGVMTDDAVSDTASASTRAIAGASLSGSLSGSGGLDPVACLQRQHRMDVHAEIVGKRLSLSSETTSMGLGDNCSAIALAGSIEEEKVHEDGNTNEASYSPVEMCVDMEKSFVAKSLHSSASSLSMDNTHLPQASSFKNKTPSQKQRHLQQEDSLSIQSGDIWELKPSTSGTSGVGRGKGKTRCVSSGRGKTRILDLDSANERLSINDSINSELSAASPESMSASQGSLDRPGREFCCSVSRCSAQSAKSMPCTSGSFTSSQSLSLGAASCCSHNLPEVESDRPTSCVSFEENGRARVSSVDKQTYITEL